MTYMPSSRDFDFQPKNRYASLRAGVVCPQSSLIDTSDLHRLGGRLVTGVVAIVIGIAIASVLPTMLDAFGNMTGVLQTLAPVAN